MIRIGRTESFDTANPRHFHGTYVPGVGRTVWAQNWKRDWVCQVMHNFSVPVGQENDDERADFVDAILARIRK